MIVLQLYPCDQHHLDIPLLRLTDLRVTPVRVRSLKKRVEYVYSAEQASHEVHEPVASSALGRRDSKRLLSNH